MAELELHEEVVEWMDTLDEAEWDRTVGVIERLATLGSSARMPLSKGLGDGLFELGFTLGSTARRITYRFTKDVGSSCSPPSASNATTNATR